MMIMIMMMMMTTAATTMMASRWRQRRRILYRPRGIEPGPAKGGHKPESVRESNGPATYSFLEQDNFSQHKLALATSTCHILDWTFLYVYSIEEISSWKHRTVSIEIKEHQGLNDQKMDDWWLKVVYQPTKGQEIRWGPRIMSRNGSCYSSIPISCNRLEWGQRCHLLPSGVSVQL